MRYFDSIRFRYKVNKTTAGVPMTRRVTTQIYIMQFSVRPSSWTKGNARLAVSLQSIYFVYPK